LERQVTYLQRKLALSQGRVKEFQEQLSQAKQEVLVEISLSPEQALYLKEYYFLSDIQYEAWQYMFPKGICPKLSEVRELKRKLTLECPPIEVASEGIFVYVNILQRLSPFQDLLESKEKENLVIVFHIDGYLATRFCAGAKEASTSVEILEKRMISWFR